MPALEGLEALLILGIDGLHGGSIAAHVGVMLLGEVLVNLLELVERLAVGEVCHGVVLLNLVCRGCLVWPKYKAD